MHNFILKWEQRFNVSSWPQNYKHCFISSKAFNSISKPFNIMLNAKRISFQNTFVVMDPSGLTLKVVSTNLVGLLSTINFIFLWWEFLFANNSWFVAFFFLLVKFYCHQCNVCTSLDSEKLQKSFSILFIRIQDQITGIAPPTGHPSICFTSLSFTLKTQFLFNFSKRPRKINLLLRIGLITLFS